MPISKMNKEVQQYIYDVILSIVNKMGFSVVVESSEYFDGIKFNIQTKDGGLLIGEDGATLQSLNHIAHRIAERGLINKEQKPLRFIVDVNDYQKKRADYICELARMSAQRARYFKKDVEMKPMTAFERRLIHTSLMEYPDIKTESIGEGENRRVVIKPV